MSLKDSEQVLAYWQWFHSLEQLNTFEDSFQVLDTDLKVEEPCLKEAGITGDAWICPFVLEHEQGRFPLIWMPVTILENGQIKPHSTLTMPYAPEQWFDPLGQVGNLLGNSEVFEGHLQQQFAPIDELEPIANWLDYYEKTCAVFKESQPELFEQWSQQKYKAARVHGVPMLQGQGPLNELLTSNEPGLSIPPLEQTEALKQLPNLCQPSNEVVPAELYPIVLQLLGLPENNLQAVKACAKSAQASLSSTLIASLQLQALLEQKKTRVLWVTDQTDVPFKRLSSQEALDEAKTYTPDQSTRKEITEAFIEAFEKEVRESQKALECLPRVFGESKKELKQQKALRVKLQKRDERLEKDVQALNKTLKEWRQALKRNWVKKMMDYVMGNNESIRTSEFIAKYAKGLALKPDLSLEENITHVLRAKKVERTKILNELMLLSESIAANEGGLQTWKKLKAEYPELNDDMDLYEAIAFVSSQWTRLCPMADVRDALNEEPFFELHTCESLSDEMKGPFEWVIVEKGQAFYAHHLLAATNQAKRAVVFGDSHLKHRPVVSNAMDYWLIQSSLGKTSEEAFEDLQFSGKVLSQSSLLTQVEHASYYLDTDPSGLVPVLPFELKQVYAHPDLMEYNLRHIHPQIKVFAQKGQGLQTLHVEGLMEAWRNDLEADAVIDYFKKHAQSDCCVVTLSYPQKKRLQEALGGKALVYTLEECPLNCEQVLFSPVYTSSTPRPHPLDYGEHLIYRLMSIATSSLVIIGDLRIFDPITHSPTGHLARILFAHDRHVKNAVVSYGQAVSNMDKGSAWLALNDASTLHMTTKAMDEKGLTTLLHKCEKNPFKKPVKIYISSLTFGQGDYKNAQLQELMQQLTALGVEWYRVKNLHRNTIMTDHSMIESLEPWLVGDAFEQSAWEYTTDERLPAMREQLEQARPIVFEKQSA